MRKGVELSNYLRIDVLAGTAGTAVIPAKAGTAVAGTAVLGGVNPELGAWVDASDIYEPRLPAVVGDDLNSRTNRLLV